MPFVNGGNQIRGSSQSQRSRETANDRNDLTLQPELCQGVVDGAFVTVSARHMDVRCGGVLGGGDFALAQRVPRSHDANVAVSKQRLRAHFGTNGLVHHACFQIDGPVAQRPTVLVKLVQEVQVNAGGFFGNTSQESGAEVLHKALAGPQRERSVELSEIGLVGGAQSSFGVMDELTDRVAKLERPG